MVPQNCHPDRTRISCHASPDTAACAAFVTESSMKSANATKLYRKSGGAQRRGEPALSEVEGDLRFLFQFSRTHFQSLSQVTVPARVV
jgi:hypothetical protein